MNTQIARSEHLTFRGNNRESRYGWLRLTPAYSVHLVSKILMGASKGQRVLDPFCGTGTTALVCAEAGIKCETIDINPFLLWLAAAKCKSYDDEVLAQAEWGAKLVSDRLLEKPHDELWKPNLFDIEKWWDRAILTSLSVLRQGIMELQTKICSRSIDLLLIAFCRVLITHANVSFGHQSMSFKVTSNNYPLNFATADTQIVLPSWEAEVKSILSAARSSILEEPAFIGGDSRKLSSLVEHSRYDIVITSPPYPNRMSYIRELRPYMYWLGYLRDAQQAGKLDWLAIGGTWGAATSNLMKWRPPADSVVPHAGFGKIVQHITGRSAILGQYVNKYFHDMSEHCRELFEVVKLGGAIYYIVGNSKFYDFVLPVEEIFATLFGSAGFREIRIERFRKRSSKRELFEFVVSAMK